MAVHYGRRNLLKEMTRDLKDFGIIKILKSFNRKEYDGFEKFVSSPYFNQNKRLTALLTSLRAFFPLFDDPGMTAKSLVASAGKSRGFDYGRFRKDMLSLMRLAEQYLGLQGFMKDPSQFHLSVLGQLNERHLLDLCRKHSAKARKFLDDDEDLRYEVFIRLSELHMINSSVAIKSGDLKEATRQVYDSQSNLLHYFILKTLDNRGDLVMGTSAFRPKKIPHLVKFFDENFDIRSFMKELIASFGEQHRNHRDLLELSYLDMLLASDETSEEASEKIRALIYDQNISISRSLRRDYAWRLISFYTLKRLSGDRKYNREIFEIYRFMLDNGLFTEPNQPIFNVIDFRNIVVIGLSNGEYDWVQEFIDRYSKYLRKESRDNVSDFCYAFLSFYKNEFEQSLEMLSKIKYESFVLAVDIYLLKAQIYYELGYLDSALASIDSFRHHLDSNIQYSDEIRTLCHLFVRLLRRLITVRKNPTPKRIENLNRVFAQNPQSAKIEWLREKAAMLK